MRKELVILVAGEGFAQLRQCPFLFLSHPSSAMMRLL
jgi:hypothetical protein